MVVARSSRCHGSGLWPMLTISSLTCCGVRNLAHTTVRAYQTDVNLCLDYATDPAYDWNEHCGQLFGTVFSQVITEFNKARHVQADDARPLKRPFTPPELQQFFDLADLEPERILYAGRKGALAAWRDAVAFKTLYGWGLRRNEVRHLQLVDFSPERSSVSWPACAPRWLAAPTGCNQHWWFWRTHRPPRHWCRPGWPTFWPPTPTSTSSCRNARATSSESSPTQWTRLGWP